MRDPNIPEENEIPIIGSGRPNVPKVPDKRTFSVRRPDEYVPGTVSEDGSLSTGPTNKAVFNVVEGHQVEITNNGDLLVFEFTFDLTPSGYEPKALLRRAFAKGDWRDLDEVMVAAPSKLIYN